MLLRILQLKDTPPYGGPSEGGGGGRGGGRTVTVPDSLHGVSILAPELQRWLLERIRWVALVCLSKGMGEIVATPSPPCACLSTLRHLV